MLTLARKEPAIRFAVGHLGANVFTDRCDELISCVDDALTAVLGWAQFHLLSGRTLNLSRNSDLALQKIHVANT
jgi:hypothetical protein